MTAVEWLVQQICVENSKVWQEEIQQALEMEKEQIIDAYERGWDMGTLPNDCNAEEYYNKTYKKDKCTCKNAELEKDSLVPVYCHNCNAYIQRNL